MPELCLATRNRIRVTVKRSDMTVCYVQEMHAVAAIPKVIISILPASGLSVCRDLIQHHRMCKLVSSSFEPLTSTVPVRHVCPGSSVGSPACLLAGGYLSRGFDVGQAARSGRIGQCQQIEPYRQGRQRQ